MQNVTDPEDIEEPEYTSPEPEDPSEEDLAREAPRHANDKCIECAHKHLLAAIGYLTSVESSAYDSESLDPRLREALVPYEQAVIYAVEASSYGYTFSELCVSALVLCEEALIRIAPEEAESSSDSAFFSTLRELRKDIMAGKIRPNYVPSRLHALRSMAPFNTVPTAARALHKAIAHVQEAIREVPAEALVNASMYDEYLVMRDLIQSINELYILTDRNKVSSVCHAVKGALLDAALTLRRVQKMFTEEAEQ